MEREFKRRVPNKGFSFSTLYSLGGDLPDRKYEGRIMGQGGPVRSMHPIKDFQSDMHGMNIHEAWKLARERFPDDKDAQVEEYRRLVRGETSGD